MNEARQLHKDEYLAWDKFVASSEQGTIFSTSKWLELFNVPFAIYAIFNNGGIQGGIVGFVSDDFFGSGGTPLTPFQGILIGTAPSQKYTTLMSFQNEVTESIMETLERTYSKIQIINHYTFPDIRPFLWAGWKPIVKYTYVVDLTSLEILWIELEKQTRYEITRAEKDGVQISNSWSIGNFIKLYNQTFTRKGLEVPVSDSIIENLCRNFNASIRMVMRKEDDMAATVTIKDDKRAYYILGASTGGGVSSFALWETMGNLSSEGIKEVDFVGCNDRKIDSFKRGFAGKLKTCLGATII